MRKENTSLSAIDTAWEVNQDKKAELKWTEPYRKQKSESLDSYNSYQSDFCFIKQHKQFHILKEGYSLIVPSCKWHLCHSPGSQCSSSWPEPPSPFSSSESQKPDLDGWKKQDSEKPFACISSFMAYKCNAWDINTPIPSILISEILAFCPRMKTFRQRRSALICRFTTSANFEFFVPVKKKQWERRGE